ncbi:MAG: M48 family metallopeptidase [Chloroflexota bacterium]
MGGLLVALGYFLGLYFFDSPAGGLLIALLIWVVMSLVAYFQGDSVLLALSGAKKIGRDDHPRLYNVVEEMKIASGLEHVPDIYIIDDPALNAFATGRRPDRAAVAITSGLLQKLNRDELQGVIGHEIAHIRNRDVLLMSMLTVLLGTIVILGWYASRVLFFSGMAGGRRRSSGGGGGGGQAILMVLGLILIILAPIAAQLIYFAVSRKREYLADASSALYTRYPEGLASALEKLGASRTQLKSANKATAPMYTVNPFRGRGRSATGLTSTHPPIDERVRILRSMAGGSFVDYDRAYRQVRDRRKGIVPASGLAMAAVPLRSGETTAGEPGEAERAREVSDVLWRLNGYRTLDCRCGARLKIPPSIRGARIACPHCGRSHQV